MQYNYDKLLDIAVYQANNYMHRAQANISGTKVGAAVIAGNKDNNWQVFGGCNLEISTGANNLHGEELALYKALADGFLNVTHVIVTSNSYDHRAAMCMRCAHNFTYINPDLRIVVLQPNNEIKLDISLRERQGSYGYWGTSKLDDIGKHGIQ